MNTTLLCYRLLLWLLAPVILLFNFWQAVRASDMRVFCQRLGLCLPRRTDKPIWLHAASVGELIAAQALINRLRESFPKVPIVVTTTTASGAKLARTRLAKEIIHCYLPLDWPGATQRFLRAIQPRAALIMETELWPNLFIRIAQQHIPLVIVNGRLSSRTMDAGPWIKQLLHLGLQGVSAVLARSSRDAENYISLGMPAARVQAIGNIKFGATGKGNHIAPVNLGRPYVLAASTRDDEERQIASLWLTRGFGNQYSRLLVIAPRHPERREAILRQLQDLQAKIAVRSRGDSIDDSTQIYLADTLGELESFMAGADIVFMGGSLVDRGGHNILEPARLGKPILFGPHMANFSDEAALLINANAAQQVTNNMELGEWLKDWLEHPDAAQESGQRAQTLMSQQSDILSGYLQAIEEICGLQNPPEN